MHSGSTWTEYNIEFVQMLYGRLSGSTLLRLQEDIDFQKVSQLFHLLQQLNPFLMPYSQPQQQHQMTTAALTKISELKAQPEEQQAWNLT